MIRRAKEMEKFVHEGLTGEKPHEVTKWLLPEDIPGHGRAFYKVVIPPKSAYFEYYKTSGEFEAIFVLEGHLDAHISGESAILGPGDFAVTETETYIEATNETDNDVRSRQIHGAQGGEGDVWFYDWPDRDELSEHGRVFSRLVIAPGASIGVHTLEGEIEAYYVSKGHPTVIDNGEEIQLNPGDMHICKNHDSHGSE